MFAESVAGRLLRIKLIGFNFDALLGSALNCFHFTLDKEGID
jgi:hypothetical protein